MKNTFAIGIPDKVSAAERDKKNNWPTPRKGELIKSATKQAKHKAKYFFWNGEKLSKVIEFDLPKGYSAEDAFRNGLYWLSSSEFWGSIPRPFNYLTMRELMDHFNESIDYNNLQNALLLLAAANGHKLE